MPALSKSFAFVAALLLSSCVLDLSNLSGGTRNGGASGGSTGSGGHGGLGGSGGQGGLGGSAGADAGLGVLDCGPCPGSGCAPVALATGTSADGPYGIALGGDGLYWVNRTGGSVMRLAAIGGAPEVLSTAAGPRTIAVSGGTVAWGAQDGVYACSIASCASTRILIAAAAMMDSISSVAYDGQYVFYADQGSGTITRCPLTAGCPGALVLGNSYNAPTGLSFHTTDLLWTDEGDGNQNGGVFVSSKGGGTTSTLSSSLVFPTAVVADDTYFYFTESPATAAMIHRCPLAGGYCQDPDDLATSLLAPLDLGLAGARIYWTDTGDGKVLSCPTSGCGGSAPQVHASGRNGLRRLALGQTCVFWTDDQGGGSVSKAAR